MRVSSTSAVLWKRDTRGDSVGYDVTLPEGVECRANGPGGIESRANVPEAGEDILREIEADRVEFDYSGRHQPLIDAIRPADVQSGAHE